MLAGTGIRTGWVGGNKGNRRWGTPCRNVAEDPNECDVDCRQLSIRQGGKEQTVGRGVTLVEHRS